MSCLDNILQGKEYIIGLRGYPTLTALSSPISGLYINDIRGITLKTAAAINNEEHASGLELIKLILTNSARLVIDDFNTQVQPDFAVNSAVYSESFGKFSTLYRNAANTNRGMQLTKREAKLTRIYISDIEVKINTTGNFDIVIDDNGTLFKTAISTIAGQVLSVPINRLCEADVVKIYLDTKGVAVAYNNNGLMSKCFSCGANSYKHISAVGLDGALTNNEFYGIKVNVTLQCCEDLLICNILNRMYFLFWLRTGVEFYNEITSSKRLNPICNMAKEGALDVRDELMREYNKKFKTFQQSIKQYLGSIKDICIDCRGVKFYNSIP